MAFYATFPEDNIIGPGIARIELGGLVSIYPPRQIPDVWRYFSIFQERHKYTKQEILLLTAIYFSPEKYIPFVSNDEPTKKMQNIAGKNHKLIIHVPLWKIGKETLEQARYIHVLKNKHVRTYARDYIFL
jgi:hypothetical protein